MPMVLKIQVALHTITFTGRTGSPAAQGKAPCEETLPPLNETKSNNAVWVK